MHKESIKQFYQFIALVCQMVIGPRSDPTLNSLLFHSHLSGIGLVSL